MFQAEKLQLKTENENEISEYILRHLKKITSHLILPLNR